MIGSFFKLKGIFKLALPNAVWRKSKAKGGFPLGVKGQELVRHVFERFADAGFPSVPGGAAEFVEGRMGALDHAVALHQVHAFQGHVQPRVFGVAEQHEFAAMAVGLDQTESLELADAVIDVNDKVAGLQLREIGEKAGGANLAAGAFKGGTNVEQIAHSHIA